MAAMRRVVQSYKLISFGLGGGRGFRRIALLLQTFDVKLDKGDNRMYTRPT